MAIYRCKRCNYLYIDEQNECCFEDLNEHEFKCPRCRCKKTLFEKIETK